VRHSTARRWRALHRQKLRRIIPIICG
jgi:hypothetical protein